MLYVKNCFGIAYDKLESLWMMIASSKVSSPDSLVCRLFKDSSPWSNWGLNLIVGFLFSVSVYLYFAPDLEFSSLRSSSESSHVSLRNILLHEKAELRNGLKIWSHFSATFHLPSPLPHTDNDFSKSLRWKKAQCGASFSLPFFHLECSSFKFWFPWQPQALLFVCLFVFFQSCRFAKSFVDFSAS